jgi:hypothetical protein
VSPLDEVATLMAERAKYEAFLRELEKGGSSKPAHVVAKVRTDYTAKLTDVTERLKANNDVLTKHANELTAKLQKLEASEKQIVDEHAEAEIRKQVGELSDVDWELSSKKAESALMKIKQEQQVAAADINRIREILGGVSATESLAKPAPVDELAFLKSVVGGASQKMPAAAPPAPRPSSGAVAPRTSAETPVARTSTPTPAPRTSVAKPVVPPEPPAPPPIPKPSWIEPDPMSVSSTPAASSPTPSSSATPVGGIRPVARPSPPKEQLIAKPQSDIKINARNSDETPMASSVPDGDIQLKAKGGGQSLAKKTLKCAECGTLNTPSEWYCERCGAELTQL